MNIKSQTLFLALALTMVLAGGSNLHAQQQQDDPKKEAVQQEPTAQILTAKIDRTRQDGKDEKPTVVVTGPSNLNIKKVSVTSQGDGDSLFTVYLTLDEFAPEVGGSLVVKVKDQIFVPYGYGGNAKAYWSLELRGIDRASAEILNGSPLPAAPKESFSVKYRPQRASYPPNGAVQVGLTLTNEGQVPLTIHWSTDGGGNYPCRDTQLSFKASLNGVAVAANPNPLPDGFASMPFVSKAHSALRRSVDLSEWLQFTKPGQYLVEATYTIEILNPEKDASPSQWKVSYQNQFPIQIGD